MQYLLDLPTLYIGNSRRLAISSMVRCDRPTSRAITLQSTSWSTPYDMPSIQMVWLEWFILLSLMMWWLYLYANNPLVYAGISNWLVCYNHGINQEVSIAIQPRITGEVLNVTGSKSFYAMSAKIRSIDIPSEWVGRDDKFDLIKQLIFNESKSGGRYSTFKFDHFRYIRGFNDIHLIPTR